MLVDNLDTLVRRDRHLIHRETFKLGYSLSVSDDMNILFISSAFDVRVCTQLVIKILSCIRVVDIKCWVLLSYIPFLLQLQLRYCTVY